MKTQLIVLVVCLLERFSTCLDAVWTRQFPPGLQLIAGDQLRIPLDDYVNTKGSTFTVKSPGLQSWIINKFSPGTPVAIAKVNTINPISCTNVIRPTPTTTYLLMLCNKNQFFRINIDNSWSYTSDTDQQLLSLNTATTVCTDIALTAEVTAQSVVPIAHLLCIDTDPATTGYTIIQIKYTATTLDSTSRTISANLASTTANKSGYARFNVGYIASSTKFIYLIYDIAAPSDASTATPSAGTSTISRCSGSATSFGVFCASYQLSTLLSPTTNFGSVRYLRYINDNSNNGYAMYAVASGVAGNRGVTIGFVSVDSGENLVAIPTTSNYNNQYVLNISKFDSNADGNIMLGHLYRSISNTLKVEDLDHFLLVDRLRLYYFSLNTQITSGSISKIGSADPNKDWSVPFECTLSAAGALPTKIRDYGGAISKFDSRLLVEYRDLSGGSNTHLNLAGLGVNFNYTKYGCYPISGGGTPPNCAIINSFSSVVIFSSSNFISNKLSPDTLLSYLADSSGSTPVSQINITLTAKTTDTGVSTPERTISVSVAKKPEDYNSIGLDSTVFRAYNGSNFSLPISPLDFNTNAPVISVRANPATTIVVNLTSASTFFVNPFNITSPATFHRAIQLDKDWTLVVLRSSGAPGTEFFSLVKVSYDSNGIPSYPLPNDYTKDPKLKSTAVGETVYKALRLWDSVCIFFKGSGAGKDKLRFNCYKLVFVAAALTPDYTSVFTNGATNPVTLLSPTVDLIDLHYMVSGTRLTYYVICQTLGQAANYEIRIGTINVTPLGSAASYSNPAALTQAATLNFNGETLLDGYYPIDIMVDYWGEVDGATLITLRMFRQTKPPILARFAVKAISANQYSLNLIRMMRLESHFLLSCPQKDEVIMYNPRSRSIFSQRWNPSNVMSAGMNKFIYPVGLYQVSSVVQFVCIPERGMFQILAKTGSSSPSKKVVVTFNGGNSRLGAKRTHSVVDVHADSDYMTTASTSTSLYTFVSSTTSSGAANRMMFTTAIYGPILQVTGPTNPVNVTVDISTLPLGAPTGATAAQASFKIDLSSAITFATVVPKIRFDLNKGVVVKLDEMVDLVGPVINIKKEGDTSQNLDLKPRLTNFRKYTPSTQASSPVTKLIVEGDFMVSIMGSTGDGALFGDPSVKRPNSASTSVPITIQELTTVKNAALVLVPNTTDCVAIMTSYSINPGVPTTYYYDLYHMQVSPPADNSPSSTNTYNLTYTSGENLLQTEIDYDALHAVYIDGQGIVIALSLNKEFASNYIKLVFLKRTPNSFNYTKQSEAVLYAEDSMDIGDYTLTTFNSTLSTPYATIIGHYTNVPGFIVAHWNLVDPEITFVKSYTNMTNAPELTNSSTSESTKLLNFNYLKCWQRMSSLMTVDCIVDAEGVLDFGIAVVLNPPAKDRSEPIKFANKTAEYEMPPRFGIKRIDRGGEYVGFHLVRNEPLLTAPASIKKFDDCINILAFFKPSKNKYVYSAALCDQFGPSYDSPVSFTMENNDKEYVYYTNSRSASEKIKVDILNSALLTVTNTVEASKIKLTFIGLNGEDAAENKFMFLDELRFGAAPPESGSNWLAWTIVAVVFIAIAGGGYGAWVWYKNQEASENGHGGQYESHSGTTQDADHSTL